MRQGHPWLFENSIQSQSHVGKAGDLAVIFDRKRRSWRIGLYDPHSPIRVRLLAHGKPTVIDFAWLQSKIFQALRYRSQLHQQETNGFRVVHGENDGLPGLVIDQYASTYVIKLYSAAWIPHLHDLLPILDNLPNLEHLILRLSDMYRQYFQTRLKFSMVDC